MEWELESNTLIFGSEHPEFLPRRVRFESRSFEELGPIRLHGLTTMHQQQRRPFTWFCHSPARIVQLCRNVGVRFERSQTKTCRRIGQALYDRSPIFRQFIVDAKAGTAKPIGLILAHTIGCLLELDERILRVEFFVAKGAAAVAEVPCMRSGVSITSRTQTRIFIS